MISWQFEKSCLIIYASTEDCPASSKQLRELLVEASLDGFPRETKVTHASKKRKNLHASQELSQPKTQQPKPQQQPQQQPQQSEPQQTSQTSQQPRSQLSVRSSNTTHGRKPKRLGVERSRKTEALGWFLRKAPKAAEWRKRQTELELNSVEQYEEARRTFELLLVAPMPYLRDKHLREMNYHIKDLSKWRKILPFSSEIPLWMPTSRHHLPGFKRSSCCHIAKFSANWAFYTKPLTR